VLALEFADEAKLYVPLEQAYLVSRYVGVGKRSPQLSSLADSKWARAKKNAASSIFDYAGKMLAVQAERETVISLGGQASSCWNFIQTVESTLAEQAADIKHHNRRERHRFQSRK